MPGRPFPAPGHPKADHAHNSALIRRIQEAERRLAVHQGLKADAIPLSYTSPEAHLRSLHA